MYGFVLIGKPTSGTWKNQYVIIGNLKENSLAKNKEEAENYLHRAQEYLREVKSPSIDPDSIIIVPVGADETGSGIHNL